MTLNGSATIASTATVTGSFTLAPAATLSGTGLLVIQDKAVLGSTGAINTPVYFQTVAQSASMPARIYASSVTVQNIAAGPFSVVMGAGNASILGTLKINATNVGAITLDGSINNPNVTVSSTVSFGGSGSGVRALNLGTNDWVLSGGDWDMRGGAFAQSPGSTLQLAGTGLQNMYSHGGTYQGEVDIENASSFGVVFQDSMTVADFTAPLVGQTLIFAVDPSAVIVQQALTLGAAGSGAKTVLKSVTPGTPWGFTLQNGASQRLLATLDIKD